MKRAGALLACAAGLGLSAWTSGPALTRDAGTVAAAGEDFRWQGRLAPGQVVEIKGINGNIEAGPAAGSEVEVSAVKRGRKSDPGSVEIKVVEHSQGVTVCAVYPQRRGQSPNECRPGRGGRMSVHDNDVSVEFRVRVPAGVRFAAHTVNGSVEALGLNASVEAETVNGSIRLETDGTARAETVNGSIRARLGSTQASLEFESVNGSITLELPGSADAEVQAETVNGDIETDFPGRLSRRHFSATIGNGGHDLRVETVNGSIRLRKAP